MVPSAAPGSPRGKLTWRPLGFLAKDALQKRWSALRSAAVWVTHARCDGRGRAAFGTLRASVALSHGYGFTTGRRGSRRSAPDETRRVSRALAPSPDRQAECAEAAKRARKAPCAIPMMGAGGVRTSASACAWPAHRHAAATAACCVCATSPWHDRRPGDVGQAHGSPRLRPGRQAHRGAGGGPAGRSGGRQRRAPVRDCSRPGVARESVGEKQARSRGKWAEILRHGTAPHRAPPHRRSTGVVARHPAHR